MKTLITLRILTLIEDAALTGLELGTLGLCIWCLCRWWVITQ